MSKAFLLSIVAPIVFLSTQAHADICGIVKTAQGRTASNIIRAQIAQSPEKRAFLIDDMGFNQYAVKDALVSNKDGFESADGKYFDFVVIKDNGQRESIDIGHTYLVINGGKTAVSLEHLTGCGGGYQEKALIELPLGGARAE